MSTNCVPLELQLNQSHSFEVEAHFVDDLKEEKRAGALYFTCLFDVMWLLVFCVSSSVGMSWPRGYKT